MALCISNVFDSYYDKQKCDNDYINFSGFVQVSGMTSGFKIIIHLSYICEDLDKYVLLTNTEYSNQFIEHLYIHKLSQQLNIINCLCGTIHIIRSQQVFLT